MASYTFTGANGDPLPAGLTTRTGGFEISNNTLVATAANSTFTQDSIADGTIQADVGAGGSTLTGTTQLFCRWTSATDYVAVLLRHSDGLIRLFKKVGGSFTQLGSNYTIAAYSNTASYTLALTTLGTSIKVFVAGVERISATDAFNQTATISGAEIRYINQDNLDNLTIPDVVGNGLLTTTIKNNAGTLLVNQTGITADIYSLVDGSLVVRKAAQTTDASGVIIVSDALIVAATEYKLVLSQGTSDGVERSTAT